MEGLRKAEIIVDRKVLSELAITDAAAFADMVAAAAGALAPAV